MRGARWEKPKAGVWRVSLRQRCCSWSIVRLVEWKAWKLYGRRPTEQMVLVEGSIEDIFPIAINVCKGLVVVSTLTARVQSLRKVVPRTVIFAAPKFSRSEKISPHWRLFSKAIGGEISVHIPACIHARSIGKTFAMSTTQDRKHIVKLQDFSEYEERGGLSAHRPVRLFLLATLRNH